VRVHANLGRLPPVQVKPDTAQPQPCPCHSGVILVSRNPSGPSPILTQRPSSPESPPPFTLVQITLPEACSSRFASFTQSGETKGARRKALNLKTAPTSDGANP
jgi:hypothetical protein